MFGLAHLERANATKFGSEPLQAEAALTFLDGCPSTGILTTLVLNAWLGWWWTDASAAFLVAAFAINEGVGHWRGFAPHEEESEDADLPIQIVRTSFGERVRDATVDARFDAELVVASRMSVRAHGRE